MRQYLQLVQEVIKTGEWKKNRTGIDTIGILGAKVKFDLRNGFPILTTRKAPFKSSMVETEGFLRGITDKAWYQKQGCPFWDQWCNKKSKDYRDHFSNACKELGHDGKSGALPEAVKLAQLRTNDLGPIYGWEWRNFGGTYDVREQEAWRPIFVGVDQLKLCVDKLIENPLDRQNLVTAWNPKDLDKMALPPCHVLWRVSSPDGKHLDLTWYQRSVDVVLGLPSNITSYAMIQTLLAYSTNMKPRYLVGLLDDTHIYENHLEGLTVQLSRTPMMLPHLDVLNFSSVFDWHWKDSVLREYNPQPAIKFEVAV